MTTALQIITKAMQKAGVLTKSEAPDADEAVDALDALNAMLSSWSNNSLLAYARVPESFPLTANVASYTIGIGQTFNTTRPVEISQAYVRLSGSPTANAVDYYLDPLSDEAYADISVKQVASIPQFYNYNYAYPSATLTFYPMPAAAYTLFLVSEKELAALTLYQDVSFPPGWERALIYNLAVEISGDYAQQVPQSVQLIALNSLQSIKRAVARNRSMDAEPRVTTKPYIIAGP